MNVHMRQNCGDGNRSSVSSEGFCENDDDMLNDSIMEAHGMSRNGDTDSQESASSDTNSSSGVQNACANSSSGNRSGESSQDSRNSYDNSNNVFCTPKQCNLISNNHSSNKFKCQTDRQVASTSNAVIMRRSSKDDSVSSSESQQSGDESNGYYFDLSNKCKQTNRTLEGFDRQEKNRMTFSGCIEFEKSNKFHNEDNILGNVKLPSDDWEILFARAEGLYAHGHSAEARRLGVRLARELLQRPPDLLGNTNIVKEIPGPHPRRKGRRTHTQLNPASHRLSVLASTTLARCAFLCAVSNFNIYL